MRNFHFSFFVCLFVCFHSLFLWCPFKHFIFHVILMRKQKMWRHPLTQSFITSVCISFAVHFLNIWFCFANDKRVYLSVMALQSRPVILFFTYTSFSSLFIFMRLEFKFIVVHILRFIVRHSNISFFLFFFFRWAFSSFLFILFRLRSQWFPIQIYLPLKENSRGRERSRE